MVEEKERSLDTPTGGPSAQSQSGSEDQRDDAVDPSAGAQGQEEGEGAVEDTREQTGEDKENPG